MEQCKESFSGFELDFFMLGAICKILSGTIDTLALSFSLESLHFES